MSTLETGITRVELMDSFGDVGELFWRSVLARQEAFQKGLPAITQEFMTAKVDQLRFTREPGNIFWAHQKIERGFRSPDPELGFSDGMVSIVGIDDQQFGNPLLMTYQTIQSGRDIDIATGMPINLLLLNPKKLAVQNDKQVISNTMYVMEAISGGMFVALYDERLDGSLRHGYKFDVRYSPEREAPKVDHFERIPQAIPDSDYELFYHLGASSSVQRPQWFSYGYR